MAKRKKNDPIPVTPRFFCDNCGTEVPQNSKNCPKCGRYFSSVRCPYCDFVGEEALFTNGCPSCGYSTASADTADKSGSSGKNGVKAKRKKNAQDLDLGAAGGLPFWVYILASAIFTAVLAELLFRVF